MSQAVSRSSGLPPPVRGLDHDLYEPAAKRATPPDGDAPLDGDSTSTCVRVTRAVFFTFALIAATGAVLGHMGILPAYFPPDTIWLAWTGALFFSVAGALMCIESSKAQKETAQAAPVSTPGAQPDAAKVSAKPAEGKEEKKEKEEKYGAATRGLTVSPFVRLAKEYTVTESHHTDHAHALRTFVVIRHDDRDVVISAARGANSHFFKACSGGEFDGALTRMQNPSHKRPIDALAYDPTTGYIASASEGSFMIWDTVNLKMHAQYSYPQALVGDPIEHMALCGTSLVSGSKQIRFADFTNPKKWTLLAFNTHNQDKVIALAKGENVAFTAHENLGGFIPFRKTADGWQSSAFFGHGNRIYSLAFVEKENLLYAGGTSGSIRVYNVANINAIQETFVLNRDNMDIRVDFLRVSGSLLVAASKVSASDGYRNYALIDRTTRQRVDLGLSFPYSPTGLQISGSSIFVSADTLADFVSVEARPVTIIAQFTLKDKTAFP